MNEFGPTPQFEQETETLGVTIAKEICELQSKASTDEDYGAILEKAKKLKELFGIVSTEAELSGDLATQVEKAREIIDVFGPEEVREAFGSQIDLSSLPNIPFSKEDLEKAKELNLELRLRAGNLTDGTTLTMYKIGEILEGKVKDEGKVFRDTNWYKDEKFFKEDPIETKWVLASKGLIADSISKNYFEQTGLLIEQLNESFGGAENLPEEYIEAVTEFAFAEEEIKELMGSSWEKAAEKLEALQINQMLRQSPAEAIYDLILHFQNKGERLLENVYDWTKRRNSGGGLVYVGGFDAVGVVVGWLRPGSSGSYLGVSFSRSL